MRLSVTSEMSNFIEEKCTLKRQRRGENHFEAVASDLESCLEAIGLLYNDTRNKLSKSKTNCRRICLNFSPLFLYR